LAAQLDMSVNISCKTGETSIVFAAALHAASVLPDIAWRSRSHIQDWPRTFQPRQFQLPAAM
jgi:hypothetical protein